VFLQKKRNIRLITRRGEVGLSYIESTAILRIIIRIKKLRGLLAPSFLPVIYGRKFRAKCFFEV